MSKPMIDYFIKDQGGFNRCPYCEQLLLKNNHDPHYGDFWCHHCGRRFNELIFNQDVLRETLNIIKGEGSELAKIFGPNLYTYNNAHGNLLFEYCRELENKGLIYRATVDRHHRCILWKVVMTKKQKLKLISRLMS